MEWWADREERVPRVGEEVVDVDPTILFMLICSEVAPARCAVSCHAETPCCFLWESISRLKAASVSAVTGKRLIVIGSGGSSSSSDALCPKTDTFGFLGDIVQFKAGLNIVRIFQVNAKVEK